MSWSRGRQLDWVSMPNDRYCEFYYDADGHRLYKSDDSQFIEHKIIGGQTVGEQIDNINGTFLLLYLFDEKGDIYGITVYHGNTAANYYFRKNLQGDVIGIWNAAGTEVVTYTYDPWGKLLSMTDSTNIGVGTLNPFRYRSYYYDIEAGLAWLDIVDNWANNFNLILIGVLECIAVGWCFRLRKVLDEINKNTKRFRMPRFWFYASVKFVAPVLLIALFGWNMFALFHDAGGSYGGYPIWAQLVAGWAVSVLVFLSGFVAKFIVWRLKKKGYTEDEVTWREN